MNPYVQAAATGGATRNNYNMLFDPAKKGATVTLSNGNRTAYCSSGVFGVMGMFPIQAECIIDFKIDALSYQDPFIGIGQADATLGAVPGADTKSLAYRGDGQYVFYNHNAAGDFPPPTGAFVCAANDKIRMQIDHDYRRFRLTQNNGTPTDWISYSMLSGVLFPIFGLNTAGQLTIL